MASRSPAPTDAHPDGVPLRVLVVDDDRHVLDLIRAQLSSAGHEVMLATSGMAALELVESGAPPHVALLDVMMPLIDGFDLLGRLREQPGLERLPAIFLTAMMDGEHVETGRALGAIYLTKPHELDVLLESIELAAAQIH